MKRLPKLITIKNLEKLNTKRLLSYLKLLNKCEESIEKSDKEKANLRKDVIEFKNTEIWKSTYKNVKAILAIREHIDK